MLRLSRTGKMHQWAIRCEASPCDVRVPDLARGGWDSVRLSVRDLDGTIRGDWVGRAARKAALAGRLTRGSKLGAVREYPGR